MTQFIFLSLIIITNYETRLVSKLIKNDSFYQTLDMRLNSKGELLKKIFKIKIYLDLISKVRLSLILFNLQYFVKDKQNKVKPYESKIFQLPYILGN